MRRLFLAVCPLVVLMAFPSAPPAAGFKYGVAAGEITTSSALLWAHATARGGTTVEVATDRRFRNVVFTRRVTARRSHDNNVQSKVSGLRAGRTYYYRWQQGTKRSEVGRFETAPAPSSNATISFAYTGDADATPRPGTQQPFYNRFQVYRRMMLERNDFNFNFGDTIYSDSEVGSRFVNGQFVPASVARTVPQKWAKYRAGLALAPLAKLRGSTGLYSHWDDHEFINDFSVPEGGRTLYRAGVQAFRDYAPVTYSASRGLYRSFRWGRNVEFFMLDERSFRSAKASAGTTCNNPRNNAPDLAPTAPQDKRNLFAVLIPSLSEPASQACKDLIANPSRTMLGAAQFARFTAAVARSTATWKIVMNEVPIQQFYALPYDRWEGYASERNRLLQTLSRLKNVIILGTDTHMNYINDARFQTLEPGGPRNSGIMEFVSGPVATGTFAREVNELSGNPNAMQLLAQVFLKPEPPDGVGMRCISPNVYSYAQVKVTNTAITITAKDINGRVVIDSVDNRTPCVLSLRRQ